MQLEELKRKTCQGQWIIPGGEGGVIKDPLERKTLGGEGGVQIKEFSIGGGVWIFSGTTHCCTVRRAWFC